MNWLYWLWDVAGLAPCRSSESCGVVSNVLTHVASVTALATVAPPNSGLLAAFTSGGNTAAVGSSLFPASPLVGSGAATTPATGRWGSGVGAPAASLSGGLFGAPAAAPAVAPSLFGGGSSFFGATATSAPTAAGGGPFGTAAPLASGSGLSGGGVGGVTFGIASTATVAPLSAAPAVAPPASAPPPSAFTPPLATRDGRPVGPDTRFEDLADATQHWLLAVEARIMEQRVEAGELRRTLDAPLDSAEAGQRNQRRPPPAGADAHPPAGTAAGAHAQAVARDARFAAGAADALRTRLEADLGQLRAVQARARGMLAHAEAAVRLSQRTRAWEDLAAQRARPGGSAPQLPAGVSLEELALPCPLPSAVLADAVAAFEAETRQYASYLERIEAATRAGSGAAGGDAAGSLESPAQVAAALPELVGRLVDCLVAAAARVERVHAGVVALTRKRRGGGGVPGIEFE